MKQVKQQPIWITETEAATLAGLDPKTFRRYVTGKVKDRELSIGYTRLTKKAEIRYNKVDIERMLMENSILPAA
jgi:predicted transcriptional regulator